MQKKLNGHLSLANLSSYQAIKVHLLLLRSGEFVAEVMQ